MAEPQEVLGRFTCRRVAESDVFSRAATHDRRGNLVALQRDPNEAPGMNKSDVRSTYLRSAGEYDSFFDEVGRLRSVLWLRFRQFVSIGVMMFPVGLLWFPAGMLLAFTSIAPWWSYCLTVRSLCALKCPRCSRVFCGDGGMLDLGTRANVMRRACRYCGLADGRRAALEQNKVGGPDS